MLPATSMNRVRTASRPTVFRLRLRTTLSARLTRTPIPWTMTNLSRLRRILHRLPAWRAEIASPPPQDDLGSPRSMVDPLAPRLQLRLALRPPTLRPRWTPLVPCRRRLSAVSRSHRKPARMSICQPLSFVRRLRGSCSSLMTWPHLWEAECESSSAFSHHGFSGVQGIDRLTMPKSAQLDRGAFSWVIILLSHFINSLSCSFGAAQPCAAVAFGELMLCIIIAMGVTGGRKPTAGTMWLGLGRARGTVCTCNITFPLFACSRDLGGYIPVWLSYSSWNEDRHQFAWGLCQGRSYGGLAVCGLTGTGAQGHMVRHGSS